MLLDGLVNGLVVRQLVHQLSMLGYRHQTNAVVRVLYGARLISGASRHANVHLVSQFPNIAIECWCGRVNGGAGTSAVECGGADADICGRGSSDRWWLDVYVLRRFGAR